MAERDTKGRRERIRSNIRDYYEFADASPSKEPPAAASGGGGRGGRGSSPNEQSELDLDSEFFSVSRYTTSLLREQSLRGLYETDTRLRRNVRELDGELQTLVYDNYSRFITATDTIRQMKDNVTEMDTKLQALSTNVESIDRVATSISQNLQSHRAKIEQMLMTNQMLRKIQFLVELPDAMRHFVATSQHHVAVKYWVAGDAILQKHSHISSFKKTHAECRKLALQLVDKLKSVIQNAPLNDTANVDATRQAVEDLRLLNVTSIYPEAKRPDSDTVEQEILTLMLSHLYVQFQGDIRRARQDVEATYAQATKDLNALLTERPDVSTRPIRKQLTEIFKKVQLELHFQTVRNTVTKFKGHLESALDLVGKLDPKDLGARLMSEVQPIMLQMVEQLPTMMTDVICGVCRVIVHVASLPMENPAMLASADVKAAVQEALGNAGLLLKGFELNSRILGGEFLRAIFDQTAQFNRLVDASLVRVFSSVLDCCVQMQQHSQTGEPPRIAVRYLAAALVARGVPRFAIGELTTGDDDLDKLLAPIHTQFTEVCRTLVHSFIAVESVTLASAARATIVEGSTFAKADPGQPSAWARTIVRDWAAAFEMLSEWFPKADRHFDAVPGASPTSGVPPTQQHHARGGSALSRASDDRSSATHRVSAKSIPAVANHTRRDNHSLASDVDRMFSRKAQGLPLRPSVVDASYIMTSVVVASLRALVELARDATFTRGGFQQLQVDCALLLESLSANGAVWFRGKCDDAVVAQVNELAASAFERCVERVALQQSDVEKHLHASPAPTATVASSEVES